MKLNLEKNFKFLFKKKVSFTMAALTIFAITGGVSFADTPQPPVQKPLKEDLDPTSNAIAEINKTNKQVNENWDAINGNRGAISNVGGAVDTNKKAIDAEVKRSTDEDGKHAEAIDKNKKAIDAEVERSTKTDAKHDAEIAENKAGIKANASAIKHLDSKLNKTTAMMTAMNNVDFQDVNAGEVAIGAGVGHFVGDQAVAVGVAYGVNDDLKVHAKWSGVAGDPHYNAIGGGVTYKFRTR